jgi:hypothetical protein
VPTTDPASPVSASPMAAQLPGQRPVVEQLLQGSSEDLQCDVDCATEPQGDVAHAEEQAPVTDSDEDKAFPSEQPNLAVLLPETMAAHEVLPPSPHEIQECSENITSAGIPEDPATRGEEEEEEEEEQEAMPPPQAAAEAPRSRRRRRMHHRRQWHVDWSRDGPQQHPPWAVLAWRPKGV